MDPSELDEAQLRALLVHKCRLLALQRLICICPSYCNWAALQADPAAPFPPYLAPLLIIGSPSAHSADLAVSPCTPSRMPKACFKGMCLRTPALCGQHFFGTAARRWQEHTCSPPVLQAAIGLTPKCALNEFSGSCNASGGGPQVQDGVLCRCVLDQPQRILLCTGLRNTQHTLLVP